MDAHKIIIGVVIVVLIYLLYLYFFGSNSTVLVGVHETSQEIRIDQGSLAPGSTQNFTYSIWVYVSNWNAGNEKIIFQRPCGSGFCPKMAFDPNMNNVTVTLATYPSGSGAPTTAQCSIENVPLQTWTNLIMTLNGNALDCYLDGKLVRTCLMPGVPNVSNAGTLVLTPNNQSFQGYTGNFQYFKRAVNPREAYSIYKEGYGGSNWLSNMFNKYRIKLAFMKDNQEVNSLEI
uniref:LamG-like jellyroll fold domain-containing protein n=1 Tax=viral metagenome TaxID=1070528 RepID=A0A6C0C447_9ZZZZ